MVICVCNFLKILKLKKERLKAKKKKISTLQLQNDHQEFKVGKEIKTVHGHKLPDTLYPGGNKHVKIIPEG